MLSGCLEISLASTYLSPSGDNPKYLQTLPNVLQELKSSLVENQFSTHVLHTLGQVFIDWFQDIKNTYICTCVVTNCLAS